MILFALVSACYFGVIPPLYSRVSPARERICTVDVPSCSRHTSGMERTKAEVGALVAQRRLEIGYSEKQLMDLTRIDRK